jgi:hypothetical protein
MSRPTCDLMLSEHAPGTTCDDPNHARAIARRAAGAPQWSPIVHGKDGGGKRDLLDGEPINCGSGLLLQGYRLEHDDYGEFSLPINEGAHVRYELDARGDVVLYADVGGYEFTKRLEPWMRFRRPKWGNG